jgi:hypothetical protein
MSSTRRGVPVRDIGRSSSPPCPHPGRVSLSGVLILTRPNPRLPPCFLMRSRPRPLFFTRSYPRIPCFLTRSSPRPLFFTRSYPRIPCFLTRSPPRPLFFTRSYPRIPCFLTRSPPRFPLLSPVKGGFLIF